MGILHQTKILFWKNFLLRIRSPGILALELLWPVMVVGIVSIMRLGAGPIKRGNCHYQPRSMPSDGAVQFLQTFMCNLNNKCYRSEQHLQFSQALTQPFTDLSQDLGSILGTDQAMDVLSASQQTVQVFDTLNKIVGDKELLHGLDALMTINSYFKDPDKVKKILVDEQQLLSWSQAEALLDAKLNVEQLLNLTGVPDLKDVACDPVELAKFIKFSESTNTTSISSSLCKLNESQISDLSNFLFQEVSIASLINAAKMVEEVKEKLNGQDGLSFALDAVAKMFEVVMRSEPVFKLLGDISVIPNIADVIRKFPLYLRNFDDFNSIMKAVKEIVNSIDPIMKNLDADEQLPWLVITDAILFTDQVTQLVEGKWNGTSEDFIHPLTSLITRVQKMADDDGSALFIAMLNFISKNDWLAVYDEIIYTSTLSERTLTTMAKSMQDILEQTSVWPDFQKGLNVAYHALDMLAIVTEKSNEMRRSLKNLLVDKGFVNVLNEILRYGPMVTNAFLDTIRNANVIGDIMRNATSYQDVCLRVTREMRGKVPDNIHSDMRDILCSEDKDFARVMNTITEKLNLSEISEIINKTVQAVEKLYEGEFFTDTVEMADFFSHYSRFTKAINDYLYDDLNWMNIADGASFDRIDTNVRAWEPIADMLNGDYISSTLLGLYQGFGQVLGNSRISKDIGPGVHVLSELMEGIYGLLYHTGELISPDSQLMKLTNSFTSYMPEIISGVSFMVENATDDVYILASSSDPLKTFCDNGYMRKMNMPAYVPMNEMNNIMCKTDWNSYIHDMENTVKTMNSLVVKIEQAFEGNMSAPYNVEADWIKMVDFTSRLWDLIRMGEIAGIIDLTTSSVKFLNQFNFTRIEEAMDVLFTEMDSMEADDVEKVLEIGIRIMENLDKNVDMSQEWQEVRRYMVVVDAFLELQMNAMNQTLTATSLSDILKMYPKDARTITVLLAKAYPETVQAMANIIKKPQEFIKFMFTNNFPAPDCHTHFLMDYALLPRDSAAHDLERFLCNINTTDFMMEFESQQSSKISERLTDLILGTSSNVSVNWRQMVTHMKEFVNFFTSSTTTATTEFDIAPFNVTAINLSWDKFYKAAETSFQLDSDQIMELSSEISTLFNDAIRKMAGDESELVRALYSESYISYITMELISEELRYFNESSEVILFDYLGSNELKKLSSFLVRSPDINAIGVATLQRLITSYGKVPITFDFDALCSNVSLFKDVFVTDVSPVEPAVLQKMLCTEISSINITLAIEEVEQNRPSSKKYLKAISILETNFTLADIEIPAKALAKKTEELTELFSDVLTNPPKIKFTADESWMDIESYTKAWEKLGEELGKMGTNTSLTPSIEETIVQSVVNILENIPEASDMFSVMNSVMDLLQSQIDRTSGGIVKSFSQYPNAKKVIDLMEAIPEAIQTILFTVITQSDKTAAWTDALQSWNTFCATPTDKIFTVPPGIQFSMADFLSKACSIDIEELGREMGKYQSIEAWGDIFSNDTKAAVNSSVIREKMNHLVESFTKLITNPEDIADFNLRLMNVTIWNEVGKRIISWSNDSANAFMSNDDILDIISKAINSTRKSLPSDVVEVFDKAMAVTDVVFTEILAILNATSLEEALHGVPDIKTFVSLLDHVPELFESILYSSLFQSQQIVVQLTSVTSFEHFCANKPEDLLTPAPNSNLDIKEWMNNLCSINMTKFVEDIMQYKAVKQIKDHIERPLTSAPKLSSILKKAEKIVNRFQGDINLKDRVFDPNVWDGVVENINAWIWPYKSMSSKDIRDITIQALTITRNNLPSDIVEYFDRAMGITDVAFTQMLAFFNATSLEKALQDIPNIKTFVLLLNHAPELFQSILYTSMNHPEKITAKMSGVTSLEQFCLNKPEEALIVAPNTNFDKKEWMKALCSINITQFLDDLMESNVTKQVQVYIEQPVTSSPEFSSLVEKAIKLFDRFDGDINIRDRVLDPDVWNGVFENIESWIWPYKSVEEFLIEQQQRFAVGALTYLENMPGSGDALKYIDAVLDLIGNRASVARENFPEAFNGFPTLQIMATLLKKAPEMIETVLYTVFTQPDLTSAWTEALMSFSTFCATPPHTIMMEPPGSNFNVTIYLRNICSIDIDTLVKELNSYQGIERFNQIANGNDTQAVNVTLITEKMKQFLHSMEDYYKDPLGSMTFNLRLFNETVWNQIGQRMERWSNSSSLLDNFGSKQSITEIINQFFGSMKDIVPELYDAYEKSLKITTVLADQILDILKEGSMQEAFKDIPSMNKLFSLADSAPELFEVLIYTSINYPEKVLRRAESLTSFEKFCASSPETMFSIPPSSNFDLNGWLTELCSLNTTEIDIQFMNFQTAKDIEKIIQDSSNVEANLTSVVEKIDNLIKQFSEGKMANDRFLRESVWSQVMSRISKWISSENITMRIPTIASSGIYLLMNQLSESDPALKEMFRPVAAMMVVLDDLMTNVLYLENKTHFGITELLEGWANMQDMMRFIQLPNVLDVLLASSSSPTFSSLFSEEGLADFCLPSTDPTKYLKAPKDKLVDLSQIKSAFCKVDFENFIESFDSFIDTHKVEGVADGSINYDWTHFQDKVKRINDLINKWISNPPKFDLPSSWTNETYWQNLLNSQIVPLEQTLNMKDQIIVIIDQMGPLLDTEGFKQVGIVLNSVLDIINENIQAMRGEHYTVENMFSKIPALKDLFNGLGLDSDTVQSLLISPVKNATLFAEILLSNDMRRDFCITDKWSKVIKFPVDFNTSGLYSAFCKNDIDVLVTKLQKNFNLETMLSQLDDDKSHLQDWKNASAKIFTLIENIEKLIENPPTFNADKTWSIMSDNYNVTNLMKLASAYSALQNTFMNESEIIQPLSSAFSIAQIMVNFLDDMMARVKLQNGRLDLASLFKGVPEIQKLVNSILDVTPDPVTGLFGVQLNPEKVDGFVEMASSTYQLKKLFCSKREFEEIFKVSPNVNFTSLIDALCNLDFNSLSQKLRASFKVNSLTKEISAALNSNYNFDGEKFTETMDRLISHIMNLTRTKEVTFQGRNLEDIFNIDYDQLMEELNNQATSLGSAFTGDYAAISSQIVRAILEQLKGFTDTESVLVALRFMRAYLHSFNSFLKSINDQPISLALLLKNTEIGHIINPILTNPLSLEGLKDATINTTKINEFLSRSSPEDVLCNKELWLAINIPDQTSRQVVQDLQSNICAVNKSVLLWQTVMLQANGYNLYKQIDFIKKDLQLGKASTDIQQVGKEMNEFITIMNTLITEYVNGTRSFEDIVDIQSFATLLDKWQKDLTKRLMASIQTWSVGVADVLLPQVLDQSLYQNMAKTLNSVNLFMNITIEQLSGIKGGTISVSVLFKNSNLLIGQMEAYIRTGKNIAKSWSDNEFNAEKLIKLFENMDQLSNLCAQPGGISMELSNTTSPSQTVKDLSTVICSVIGSNVTDELKKLIDYDQIEKTLISIWDSKQVKPDYATFVNNVDRFSSLIEDLSKTSFNISSRLSELFQFNSLFKDITNIADSPELIFRLMKLIGIFIESPLRQEQEVVKSLSQMNSFVLMPLAHILEALQEKGISLTTISDSPDDWLNILSVAVDFKVHFDVIKEFAVKPQIKALQEYQGTKCLDPTYPETIKRRVYGLQLPVTGADIFKVICNSSSSDWIKKFEEMGLTNIQITVLTDSLLAGSDISALYDKDFGWVQLMSSLEKLTSLITKSGDESRSKIASLSTTWDHVKHLVFDKSFKSLLSYLQLFEGSQPYAEGWMKFKQYLKFSSSVMKFLDNNLQKFNGNGTVILFKDILPSSETVSNLTRELFGPQTAAEFLVMAVNPEMFYKISMRDTWDDICNKSNSDMFTWYFQFPDATNVDALKKGICEAVLTRRTSFQKLLDLFNAGDMLKQLQILIDGQLDSSSTNASIWDATHSVMMHLIGTFENLQKAMVKASSVEEYFTPILNVLNSLYSSPHNSQIVSMCNALVTYLNETEGFAMVKQIMSYTITTSNLMTDISTLVPDIDDIMCALGTNVKLDLVAFTQKLSDLGLMKMIDKAASEYNKPPDALRCLAPFDSSKTLMDVINSTIEGNLVDVPRMEICFQNIERGARDMVSSVTKAADFLRDIGEVMQLSGLTKLFTNADWIPIVDFIIDVFDENANITVIFEDLLEDRNKTEHYLTAVLGLSDVFVDALMKSVVNDNWQNILQFSLVEVEDILCNPARLKKAITLPEGSLINMTVISRQLCSNDTAIFLKNMSVPLSGVSEILKTTSQITKDVSELIVDFKDIIEFLIDLLTNFSFETIRNDVDMIDKILANDEFNDLGKRLKSILHGIKRLAAGNSATVNVLNDVEIVIDGLLSIDFIKEATIKSLQVKDVVDDPDKLRSYLLNELSIPEQQVDNILNGAFSLRVILGIDDKTQHTCEDVMKRLIILNDTQTTRQDLENALCKLDSQQLENLFNALKVQLNIGSLVAKYVSYTADSVLKSTNLTKMELNDVVQKIDRGQYILGQATDLLYNTANGSEIMNVFGGSYAAALSNMNQLTPLICGEDMDDIFALDFTPGVVISSKEDLASELKAGVEDNIEDLKNEFCIDLYEMIKTSKLGGFLWAYLKPIMRGKILYTPVNAVTQAIVEKTNRTFEGLEEISRVSNIWANGASNLNDMVETAKDTEDLRNALENDFIKGILKATIGVSPESIISGLDALQSNNVGPKELNALQTAAELVANLTSCLEFNRFQGVDSEEEMEKIAYTLSQRKLFFGGIVFLNSEDSSMSNSSGNGQGRRKRQAVNDIPKHVSYKIRMDVDNVMDTNHLKSPLWKMIAEDNFVEDLRYLRGFIQIQDMLDHAIIDLHKDPAHSVPGAKVKQMPFPCHHIDNFIFILGTYLVPVMMTFVFLASIGVATYNLVYDRENGQEKSLQVMGMIPGANFIVWLISTMFIMAVVSFVMAIMLKYTDIFIYSNYFVLFLYILDFCFSSVMLLYMVSSFFNRTTMAILFVVMTYLITYLPYILVISLEVEMEFWHKIVACLASTTAFSFGAHNLAKLEEIGQGLQWYNIKSEAAQDFSVHWSCIMMLIDSAIYFVIGWYVRHVKPGKYGIPEPWYFPLRPCFWSSCFNSCCTPSSPKGRKSQYVVGTLFEASSQELEVGISIENLSKCYGKKQVLENMNLDIYKGQVTCLLGHNGAAKTTTLKMLYGVLHPSSGRIRINGKKPSDCKNILGICPQQNALFDYMNVIEHMKFYAGVKKGGTSMKVLREIRKLLEDVDLWHERNIPARELSYGMKRRLCVALAFVAGSEIVILDEPTSGIDPHARRNIWNLISSNREGRTILLSTHHLDEADIIGDRIAIMHTGKLLCCGSPAFLKKTVGGGFKLSITKSTSVLNEGNETDRPQASVTGSDSTTDKIFNFVKSNCSEAVLAGERGKDIWINLPKNEKTMRNPFQLFFKELDEKSKDFGIAGYGISDTTLEEIFLFLTNKADTENEKGNTNLAIQEDEGSNEQQDPEDRRFTIQTDDSTFYRPGLRIHYDQSENLRKGAVFDGRKWASQIRNESFSNDETKKRKQGLSLKLQQIMALIIKRCIHYHRNWRLLLTCILLPLLSFLIAMAFSTIRPDEGHSKPLMLDPTIYGLDTYTFFKREDEATSYKAEVLTLGFRDSNIGIGATCMADYNAYDTRFSVDCLNQSSLYNVSTPFFLPRCEDARQAYYRFVGHESVVKETLTVNQLRQQDLDDQNIPFYLMRTFRDYKDKRFGGWSVDKSPDKGALQVDPYVWFNSKGYHAMPSFFNSLSNVLLRTHLPPTENPDEYGITAINHPVHLGRNALTMKTVQNDAADAGIAIVVVIAFSFIPCGFMLYLIGERMQKEKQLQHISGVGLFMYWVTSFLCDLVLYAISVGIAVIIVLIFKTDAFYERENLQAFTAVLILYGWAIIPFQYFLSHFFKKGSTAFLVSFCLNLFLALVTIISLLVMQLFKQDSVVWDVYKECRYLYLIFPQYALGQGLMEMVANTVKYNILKRFDEDFYEDPFSMKILGWHLVALAAFGFFFFIVNLLWECKKSSALSLPKKKRPKDRSMDVDVAKEKDRIFHGSNSDVLTVNGLSKVYRRNWKKFCAVDRISFGVPKGECFGLLGVNGAGKTTTFRMLTGDLTSSYGTAMLNGAKISSMSHQLRQGVGYCPQEGGLDEYLTATETLYFHSRLKGFDKQQTKAIVDELLTRLHLKPYANRAVHKYSGGTKRKLALAVAMLGNPPILYLDEPTTGMDAATRRLAWKCIARANKNGQSVVLTSHMMDECDALCSRIAIMVNGEIKCIGSPQHLKQRFGEGYTIVIHGNNELLRDVSNSFMDKFPGAVMQVRHFASLQVMIPHNGGHVADILTFLQHAQQEGLIEYYSLSQTTLDSVFISFAQDQSDHLYDASSSSYTPSGSQQDTPTGSISSSKSPPSYSSGQESKNDKDQVFRSPRFINQAFENDYSDPAPQTRYVTNMTLGSNANVSSEYDNAPPSEPKNVSIAVHKDPEPDYDNAQFNNQAFEGDDNHSQPGNTTIQSSPRHVSSIVVNRKPEAVYDNFEGTKL